MDGCPQLVSNMAALQVGEVWQLLRIHRDAQKDEDVDDFTHIHVYIVWQLAGCATCVCAYAGRVFLKVCLRLGLSETMCTCPRWGKTAPVHICTPKSRLRSGWDRICGGERTERFGT